GVGAVCDGVIDHDDPSSSDKSPESSLLGSGTTAPVSSACDCVESVTASPPPPPCAAAKTKAAVAATPPAASARVVRQIRRRCRCRSGDGGRLVPVSGPPRSVFSWLLIMALLAFLARARPVVPDGPRLVAQRRSTLTTWKSSPTYTVTGVPSASVMWASYSAWPSASVSTRTIVPPGTFAFSAASTFAAVSPVSGVSSPRWPPHGCRPPGPPWSGRAGVAGWVVVPSDEPGLEAESLLAALAIP